MYWLIFLAIFFIQNKFISSWNSSNSSCNSNIGCLLLQSFSESNKAWETDTSREINVWHPVPKWKVFSDANRNRTSFSSPHFEQDFSREEYNSFSRSEFSSTGDRKRNLELSNSLNIQFLPLKDGNITIKSLARKLNESSTEEIALFVIYSHVTYKKFSGAENNSESLELESKMANKKENIYIKCKDLVGCSKNSTMFVIPLIKNNETSQSIFSEEVITIPIISNMTIEMKIGKSDKNNYTVMIIPVQGNFTSMKDNMTGNVGDIIKIPLTQNMSLIMKSEEHLERNDTFLNGSEDKKNIDGDEKENKDIEPTENIERLEDSQSDKSENITEETISSFNNDNSTISSEVFESEYNLNRNDTLQINSKEYNSTSVIENRHSLNTTFEISSGKEARNLDEAIEIITERNEYPNNESEMYHFRNNTLRNPKEKLQKFEYSKTLGPFEVKQLNSSSQPFIATLHIVIKNKEKHFSSLNEEYYSPNKTITSASDDSVIQNSKIHYNFERSKRNINKYVLLNTPENFFQNNNGKQKFINSDNNSNQNEHFNKNQGISLNETKGTAGVMGLMNNGSLILQSVNKKEQSNLSNLSSFSEEADSYISSANSESNEKFNRKGTHKFKNKAFIANVTSAGARGTYGTKSNRIASGNESKRETALPTLIQNKDLRENHPEKSELQIEEEGSVDKYWKMKTPPGQLSKSKGIKSEKMCDLKYGCSVINDRFNIVTAKKSVYLKDQEEKNKKLNSNEEVKKNKERFKKTFIYKRSLIVQKTDQSVAKSEEYKRTVRINKISNKRNLLNSKVIINLKNNNRFENTPQIMYSLKDNNKILNNRKIQNLFIVKEDEISPQNRDHNLKKRTSTFNTLDDNWNASIKRFNQETNHDITQTKQVSQFSLKNFITMPSLSKSLLRNKRSKLGLPFIPNDKTVFYLMTLDDSPNGVPHNMKRNNYYFSKRNENKTDDKIVQNVPLSMFQMNPVSVKYNSERQIPFSQAHLQNRIGEWFQRGSKWSQNNAHSEQIYERELLNRMIPTQNWFIIIPGIVKPTEKGSDEIKPAKFPSKNEMENPRYLQVPSEREREDDIFEDKEWVIVNQPSETPTIKNPPNRIVNNSATLPPKANKPREIINSPPRKPKFATTEKPWSPDVWNYNPWTVSKNPWKTFPTTPMMMMGGMGNGD